VRWDSLPYAALFSAMDEFYRFGQSLFTELVKKHLNSQSVKAAMSRADMRAGGQSVVLPSLADAGSSSF
jgi:hypothetical protein